MCNRSIFYFDWNSVRKKQDTFRVPRPSVDDKNVVFFLRVKIRAVIR